LRQDRISTELADIRKHVKIVNEEVGVIKLQMASIGTDLKWIKYFVGLSMVLALSSLGIKLVGF